MKRILLIVLLCFSGISHSLAQKSGLQELCDKMFFNIFIYKPDTSVYDFVKAHFPEFTEPHENRGWTIYPPGLDTLPIPYQTTYSLKFKSHPYFTVPFAEGRLDLLAIEAKGYQPTVQDYQLWFMFNSKKQAAGAFKFLLDGFAPVSKSRKIWVKTGKQVAQFSGKKTFDYRDAVEIILTKDELYENRYKIYFRNGAFTYR